MPLRQRVSPKAESSHQGRVATKAESSHQGKVATKAETSHRGRVATKAGSCRRGRVASTRVSWSPRPSSILFRSVTLGPNLIFHNTGQDFYDLRAPAHKRFPRNFVAATFCSHKWNRRVSGILHMGHYLTAATINHKWIHFFCHTTLASYQ